MTRRFDARVEPLRAEPSACTIPTVADSPFIAALAATNHTYTRSAPWDMP